MSEIVAAYSDGGVLFKNPSTQGGTWAWCHVDADDTIVDSASGVLRTTPRWPVITNNYSEMVAALRCLEALPPNWSGKFYCDSQITLGRIFQGWATEGIPVTHLQRMKFILSRLGRVTPVLLSGHPTKVQLQRGFGKHDLPVSAYNVWCDNACKMEQQKFHDQELSDMSIQEIISRMFPDPALVSQDAPGGAVRPQEARSIPDEWFTTG